MHYKGLFLFLTSYKAYLHPLSKVLGNTAREWWQWPGWAIWHFVCSNIQASSLTDNYYIIVDIKICLNTVDIILKKFALMYFFKIFDSTYFLDNKQKQTTSFTYISTNISGITLAQTHMFPHKQRGVMG